MNTLPSSFQPIHGDIDIENNYSGLTERVRMDRILFKTLGHQDVKGTKGLDGTQGRKK